MVLVMGEITTTAYVDIPRIVRNTVREIGYTGHETGFDADACAVLTSIDEQSPDIAMGVDHSLENREGLEADELGDRCRRPGHDVRLCQPAIRRN